MLNELSKDGGLDSGKLRLLLWQIWRVDEFWHQEYNQQPSFEDDRDVRE